MRQGARQALANPKTFAWGCLEGFQDRLGEKPEGAGRREHCPERGALQAARPPQAPHGLLSTLSTPEASLMAQPGLRKAPALTLRLGPPLLTLAWLPYPAQDGLCPPGSECPPMSARGWHWGPPGPLGPGPRPCQAAMPPLNSASPQPPASAQHPEAAGCRIHPWRGAGVRTLLGAPSSQPVSPLWRRTQPLHSSDGSHRLTQQPGPIPGGGRGALFQPAPPPPWEEMEGGTEVFQFVQLGKDVKWN